MTTELDRFTQGYIECALWSSTDDGDPLDGLYSVDDLSPETMEAMVSDCAAFQENNSDNLKSLDFGQSGHDFWLTRNRHGAGFWDRELVEIGTKLTEASLVYGSIDLYIGDDGSVHH